MAHLLIKSTTGTLAVSVVATLGLAAGPLAAAAATAAPASINPALAVPTSVNPAAAPTALVAKARAGKKPAFKASSARYGAQSASVRKLQRKLIKKRVATAGLRQAGATGAYYAQTQASVKKFQRKIGYGAAATGIVDARTVKRLGLRWIATPVQSTIMTSGELPTGTNGGALTGVQLKSVLVAAGFREPAIRTAWGIAMRESRAYPRVVSPKNSNGTRDHGLFQINDVHRAHTDFTNIYDPVYNASVAFRLSD
ncbi:MAG: peptidoglycan-binding protein, partial [Candidatus Nanopelagicales bacterium]